MLLTLFVIAIPTGMDILAENPFLPKNSLDFAKAKTDFSSFLTDVFDCFSPSILFHTFLRGFLDESFYFVYFFDRFT